MSSEFGKRQKEDFFRDITSFGSLWWFLIIIFLFLAVRNYEISKRLILGFVLIYSICVAIRSFYFKDRPKKYGYKSYIEKIDASSFPSLHSSRAVFLSLVLIEFLNNAIISVFIFILAIVVLYSRIHLKKHDWRDVIAGLSVGSFVYIAIIKFL